MEVIQLRCLPFGKYLLGIHLVSVITMFQIFLVILFQRFYFGVGYSCIFVFRNYDN